MKKFPKYLLKLISFGLVIVIVPVLAVSVFSAVNLSDIIKKKVSDSNIQLVEQIRIRTEQSLKAVDATVVQLLNSMTMSKVMEQPFAGFDPEIYSDISKSLYNLHGNDLPIYNINLVNFSKGWVINTSGLYRLSGFKNSKIFSEYAKNDGVFWIREDKSGNGEADIGGYNMVQGVSLVRKIPINSREPEGLIVVQVRQADLDKYVIQSDVLGRVIITDDTNRVLHADEEDIRGRDVSLLPYVKKALETGGESGVFDANVDDQAQLVTFNQSKYNNWTYFSVLPQKDILKSTNSIIYLNAVLCFVFVLIFGGLSVWGAKRMYTPIGKIYKQIKRKDEEPDGVRDELKYIGESIDTLLTDRSNLAGILKDSKQQIMDYYNLRLYQSGLPKEDLSMFPQTGQWKLMCVFSVCVYEYEASSYETKDSGLILFAIHNVMGELIPQEHRLVPQILDEFVTTVVGGSFELGESFKSYLLTLAATIQEKLRDYLGIKVNIAVSEYFNDLLPVHQAFLKNKQLLKYQAPAGQESIIFAGEVKNEESLVFSFPKKIENALIEAIRLGEEENTQSLLHEFILSIGHTNTSINKYHVSVLRLIMDIINILPEEDTTPIDEFINGKTLIDNIMEQKTAVQSEEWIFQYVIQPILEKMALSKDRNERKLSTQMMIMVENEYDTDLTLEVCGERLHYNPNYLRRVFMEETGTTFSEYLWEYRINVAKILLLETDDKISEIAAKLRYNNSQNFIRSFRKKVGKTPGEYRGQNEKGREAGKGKDSI